MNKKITIGSRGSKLALLYAQKAKEAIIQNSNFNDETIVIKSITTKGDQVNDFRLSEFGGKGLFSSNIEKELQDKNIDIAVHALKDLPATETKGLLTDTFLKRNDPKEILISKDKKKLRELDLKSVVGTSSYRREFQIKKIRPDINCKLIRGNVDTRIRKLKNGEYDAIILAKAGLSSLNLVKEITQEFSNNDLIPSAGQGTIAVQCRKDDVDIIELLNKINHEKTSICVKAEREVLKVLDGDCETAVGATSKIVDDKIYLSGELFSIDGSRRYFYETSKKLSDFHMAGEEVGKKLKEESQGNYKK